MADDALIEDTTTPEVLAQEAAVLAGTAPDVVEVPEAPAAEAPAPTTPPPEAAAPAPEAPPAPQPRTYSEAEVRQMQATARGRIEAERRQAEEIRHKLAEINRETQVEAVLRQEEARLAPTMGADEARQFVRSPERTKLVRDHYAAQDQLREVNERAALMGLEQELQAKVIVARQFAQQFNVAPADQDLLLSVSSPDEMKKVAQRLGQQKADAAKATADRRALVPAETKQTSLESGISGTSSPESDESRLERINRTPSWEWSDADYKYMKGH